MPTPGSPASNTTEPGTTPPPRTRFNSGEGRVARGSVSIESSANSTGSGLAFGVQPLLFERLRGLPPLPLAAGSGATSTSGAVEPHIRLGQKPIHLGLSCPQAGHANTVRFRSLAFTAAPPTQSLVSAPV